MATRSPISMVPPAQVQGLPRFSLIRGGLLYRLWLKSRLTTNALEFAGTRAVLLSALCVLPMFVFALLHGIDAANAATSPLNDADLLVRFLLVVPILVVGELYTDVRLEGAVQQFARRNLIPEECRGRFEAIIASTHRLRDALWPELLLLLVAYTLGHRLWLSYASIEGISTWYATVDGKGMHYNPAGLWLAFISMPFYQFLILRWYWRLVLWYQFVWRVRSLPLSLKYFHPDRAGGLGFLDKTSLAFAPILLAQSANMSGVLANRILHEGATLSSFKVEIVATIVFSVVSVCIPLLFFVPLLDQTKRLAAREFGTLAAQYVERFREKWIEDGGPRGDLVLSPDDFQALLLGHQDFQSLADLANSFDYISQLRVTPLKRNTLIELTVTAAFPLVPLLLSVVPLEQVVERLLKGMI
jgi:hypothetical protein